MVPARLELRDATLDDAPAVADLETARTPDDPRDGAMVAFWWTHGPAGEVSTRRVADRDGGITVFLSAWHLPWTADQRRFGSLHVALHPSAWTPELFGDVFETAEAWLLAEGAETAVTRVHQDLEGERRELGGRGYREVRLHRNWELDLVAGRDRLLAEAERTREGMRRRGVELTTLDRLDDERTLRQVYELDMATTADIPTTVPAPDLGYAEWAGMYFENPGIRKDRFWIALSGGRVVGMSLIEFPPGRGVPTTEFTGTAPEFRGRGIARALKYETVAQAIALGVRRLRTENDAENAPILRLNTEMGYAPAAPLIELHRELGR